MERKRERRVQWKQAEKKTTQDKNIWTILIIPFGVCLLLERSMCHCVCRGVDSVGSVNLLLSIPTMSTCFLLTVSSGISCKKKGQTKEVKKKNTPQHFRHIKTLTDSSSMLWLMCLEADCEFSLWPWNTGGCCFPYQSQINALTLWLNACSIKLKCNNDLHASPLMLVYPSALKMFTLPGKYCGFTLPSCWCVCVGSDVQALGWPSKHNI